MAGGCCGGPASPRGQCCLVTRSPRLDAPYGCLNMPEPLKVQAIAWWPSTPCTLHATHRKAGPVDMIVEAIDRRYVTTVEEFDTPWSYLARFVPDLRVGRVLARGAYVFLRTHGGPPRLGDGRQKH